MKWGLTKEKQRGDIARFVIKRWNPEKGAPERLPVASYRHIRDNEEDLKQFVKRLNAPLAAITKADFKHAFIDEVLLEEYFEYLTARISTQSVARTQFVYLKKHFLNFFICRLDAMNPNDWHRLQTKWAQYLLGPDAPPASKTKKDIIIEANRFMAWLSDRRPTEIHFKKFEPLTKSRLTTIDAERELRGETSVRKLITDAHWETIRKALPPQLKSLVLLGYHYGLRRSECLGLVDGDVKKGYLSVERQLRKIATHGILKGKVKRRINHWFATAEEAYSWVASVKEHPMNPTTLSVVWRAFMDTLRFDYDFHDLRHTFITKAVRKYNIRDVQLAAGHKHISVTMGYLHDDRTLADEEFEPL